MTKQRMASASFLVLDTDYNLTLDKDDDDSLWVYLRLGTEPLWGGCWKWADEIGEIAKSQNEFLDLADKVRQWGLPALMDLAYDIGWTDGRWGQVDKWSVIDDKATE